MRAGKSAADYARASFSNPEAARKIAETAWEAGRAAADYVQTTGRDVELHDNVTCCLMFF